MTEPGERERRIALFLAFSGPGGVEIMAVRLLQGLVRQLPAGWGIDLVITRDDYLPYGAIPQEVRVWPLGVGRSSLAWLSLARYLAAVRPDTLLVAKERAIRSAVIAARLAGTQTKLLGWAHTTVSQALVGRAGLAKRWRYRRIRRYYSRLERVICVSQGVAEDLERIGRGSIRTAVIRNPVISEELRELAGAPIPHPWLNDAIPVVIGAGRLTRQKDFATLLRAIACVNRRRTVRLILLGEGDERPALEALGARLGLTPRLALVGHVTNAYAWLSRADLFALSSRWEGSPTVLTEALALGVPVVATDCPSGPRELLANGRYGPLVPMGDAEALASAIEYGLDRPADPEALRAAVAEYTVAASAERFARALLGDALAKSPGAAQ